MFFTGGSGIIYKYSNDSVVKTWQKDKKKNFDHEVQAIEFLKSFSSSVVQDFHIVCNFNINDDILISSGILMPYWKYNLENDVLNVDTKFKNIRSHVSQYINIRYAMVKSLLDIVISFMEIGFNHGDFKAHNMQIDKNYNIHVIDFDHSSFSTLSRNDVCGQDDFNHLLRRIVQILMMVTYDEIYIECEKWCKTFDKHENCRHVKEYVNEQEHFQTILSHFDAEFSNISKFICTFKDNKFQFLTSDNKLSHLKKLKITCDKM